MTILGDIAQGVHYYRGIENWQRFIDVEFSDVDATYTTLKKTYRTTKEIMDVANSVISKLPDYEKEFIVFGEPVIDRKNSINIQKKENFTVRRGRLYIHGATRFEQEHYRKVYAGDFFGDGKVGTCWTRRNGVS